MTNLPQRSFAAGELSPSLYARTDLARYQAGLRTIRNFIVLRDGGITNRAGTAYVGICPTARLLPFTHDDTGSVLEFSVGAIRIVTAGSYTGVTIASPYAAADLFEIRYSQHQNVLTLTHPDYPVYELTRTSAAVWTMLPVTFGPGIDPPTNLTTTGSVPGTNFICWVVTAIAERGVEGYASDPVGILATLLSPRSHTPRTLTWDAVTGARAYNVYKAYLSLGTGTVGTFGYIGTTNSEQFYDSGLTPDEAHQPPREITDFTDPPAAVGGYQQRRLFAATTAQPAAFWASRTADLSNISESTPIQDDDALEATIVSNTAQTIRHIVDADTLYLLTTGGEWKIQGDGAGVLRPTDINALNFSKHGSSLLPPIVIDRRILFVQARQSIVRQIVSNEVGPGYVGANLTLSSSHLFKGYTLSDWAYAQEPHSVVWCVRSDGVLLGFTTLEEDGAPTVQAWHRHDTTGGLVESVAVVPESGEDRLYLVVNRDGVRMLERMASRFFTDLEDVVCLDSSVTVDGRNTSAETMTLSGSTTWDYGELVTVTRSVGVFAIGDIGAAVDFVADDGLALRVTLTAFTSATVMQGFPSRLIPADLQSTATAEWTFARLTITDLSHLDGQDVSVVGDGYVVASPNNPNVATVLTVSGGSVTLPAPYGYVHVGLPITADAEPLDIDTPSGRSLKDTKILINNVTVYVESSRSFFAGQSFPTGDDLTENLDEAVVRDVSDDYGPTSLTTDTLDVLIKSSWKSSGRFVIRHVDPSPLTILALIPRGEIG